jgi:hypothetical protein
LSLLTASAILRCKKELKKKGVVIGLFDAL